MIKKIKNYWPHILFIIGLIILIFFIYQDYGIGWDEPYYANYGRDFVNSFFNLLNLKTNLTVFEVGTKELHLKGHGVFFDILITLSTLFFKNFNFESFHLIKALFAVPTFIFIGLVVNNFFGPVISLGSMLLLVLFPKFFGDMFINSIDIMTALSLALTMAFFIYYIKSDQSLIKKLGLALIMAIMINQRLVLGYLFGLNLLIILIINFFLKVSWKKNLSEILFLFFATIFFMHLTHPYLLRHPIKGIYEQLLTAKNYTWTATVFFEGKRIWAYDLPWYYLLKLLLITIPLTTLILFFLGIFYLIKLFILEKKQIEKWLYIYILLTFFIPVFLAVWLRPTLYDSWRQMLFLTIPIIIIASFGLKFVSQIKFQLIRKLLLILISAGLIFTGWEIYRYHPYEYIYFNQLVGGVKNAYKDYETEYNCLSYKEAVRWLINYTRNKSQLIYRIYVVGEPFTASYYFPKNFYLTNDLNQADYLISLTRWDLHLAFPGEPIHVITHLGVPMTYIKKLR